MTQAWSVVDGNAHSFGKELFVDRNVLCAHTHDGGSVALAKLYIENGVFWKRECDGVPSMTEHVVGYSMHGVSRVRRYTFRLEMDAVPSFWVEVSLA